MSERPAPVYRSIPEQIVEQLRLEIMTGQFDAGTPLREQELSARFRVSRGPVRDALLKLGQDGLVTARPNAGAAVAARPNESIRPLITDIRRRIEGFALTSIFAGGGAERLARLETRLGLILDQIRHACERGDVPALVAGDVNFHEEIMTCYGDPDLLALWRRVIMRMLMRYDRFDDLLDSFAEHRRIYRALAARDEAAALRALRANIV